MLIAPVSPEVARAIQLLDAVRQFKDIGRPLEETMQALFGDMQYKAVSESLARAAEKQEKLFKGLREWCIECKP